MAGIDLGGITIKIDASQIKKVVDAEIQRAMLSSFTPDVRLTMLDGMRKADEIMNDITKVYTGTGLDLPPSLNEFPSRSGFLSKAFAETFDEFPIKLTPLAGEVEPKLLPPICQSAYLWNALTPENRRQVIAAAVRVLRPHAAEFDAIVFRGMSGALIAPSVADRLKKNLVMVRKPEDGSHHSCFTVEGVASERYVIVDDFISTGNTIDQIRASLARSCGVKTPPVAVYVYAGYPWEWEDKGFPVWYDKRRLPEGVTRL